MKFLIAIAAFVGGVFLVHWGLELRVYDSWSTMAGAGAFVGGFFLMIGGPILALTYTAPGKPIVLDSNEWVATDFREERYQTTMIVGSVLIPQWHTRRVPVEYRRR